MRTIFSTCSVIICLALAHPATGVAQSKPTTAGEKAKQTTAKATQVVEDPAITAAVKSKLLADTSGVKKVVNNLTVTAAAKPAATPATKAPPKKTY